METSQISVARVFDVAGETAHTIDEVERVRAHLEGAERFVASCTAEHDRTKSLVRALLIEALRDYREAGSFPKNRDFPDKAMPYFIDADGTRCAVAHLMELGGAAELVARIARERNHAFVRELVDDAEIVAWLGAAGISVEEAARIQPDYCSKPSRYICHEWATARPNADGVLEILVVTPTQGRVVAVHGYGGDLVVGDVVELSTGESSGASLLLVATYEGHSFLDRPGDAGAPDAARTIRVSIGIKIQDGVYRKEGHSLSKEQVLAALRSTTCDQDLAAIDAWWGKETCSDNFSNDSADPVEAADSCAMSAGRGGSVPSSATAAILISLVGALTARRAARALRSRT